MKVLSFHFCYVWNKHPKQIKNVLENTKDSVIGIYLFSDVFIQSTDFWEWPAERITCHNKMMESKYGLTQGNEM
jgi:surface polysaccharide O-acyltransferase-like enzyme